MMRTFGRRATVFSILLLAAAAAGAKKDTWTGVERIVAVGDVHGDYDQFVAVLRAAKVIDEKGDWSGGKTHLVQTGDVLDRAPDSRKALDLLMKLETQAAKAGGAVHAMIGNHEAMVMLGDWRYVHPGEIESFGGKAAFARAFSPQGKYGKWILSHNTVVKINDVLFCHAGLTAACAKMSLEKINAAVRDELTGGSEQQVLGDPEGPLWTRELALGDEEDVARQLDEVFKAFGARRMVIAHTVNRGGVMARAGGRLIRIDVGMSKYYGRPAACLVIDKGVYYEVTDGEKDRDLKIPATQPATRKADEPARKAA